MRHDTDSGNKCSFLRFDQSDTLGCTAHRRDFLEVDPDDDSIIGHDQTVLVTVDRFKGNKITVLLVNVDSLNTFGTS